MTDIAIKVEELGKRYRIGMRASQSGTRRQRLKRLALAPFEYLLSALREPEEEETIWALRDVSFEVKKGEVLGVIGHNGAGKSTLLKILSRITEPTRGRVEAFGRVASLLEVGTGFHPELTGRENVYMSGAILGMRRAEIDRKFDDIVDFSGVERFIDMPVKRYSSGMYVRLAFAVAAFLETEIVLLDEVLAVGDAEFQKRCLGKMEDVSSSGRTILFVSHNLSAIKSLCKRAILFERGKLKLAGAVDEVVSTYLTRGSKIKGDGYIPVSVARTTGTGEAILRMVRLTDCGGNPISQVFFGQRFRVAVIYETRKTVRDAVIELGISTSRGQRIATATSLDEDRPVLTLEEGFWEIIVEFDVNLLPGEYAIDVFAHHWLQSKVTIDWVESALTFSALDVPLNGSDGYRCFQSEYDTTNVRGFIRPLTRWYKPDHVQMPEGRELLPR
jgi:lipopolysaccharide transport system ATP-binding protein